MKRFLFILLFAYITTMIYARTNFRNIAFSKLQNVNYPKVMRFSKEVVGDADTWYSAYLKLAVNDIRTSHVISRENYSEIIEYWEKYIPERYVYLLVNESLHQQIDMRHLYTISRIESINYTVFTSLIPNKNGSVDVGLMGLNNKNFDVSTELGKKFLNAHFIKNYIEPENFDYLDECHITRTCSDYFKSLKRLTKSTWGAVAAYNCGYGRYRTGKIPKQTRTYANYVYYFEKRHKTHPLPEYSISINSADILYLLAIFNKEPIQPTISLCKDIFVKFMNRVLPISLNNYFIHDKKYLEVKNAIKPIWSDEHLISTLDESNLFMLILH